MARKNKKDYNYFEYFREVGGIMIEAAELLKKTICEFDHAMFPDKMDEIHEIEHRADSVKHSMIERLAHEFITPIEREDIVELSQYIDDVVDCIDDVARCIYMYNVTTLREETAEFCEIIAKSCASLGRAIDEFENFKTTKTLGDIIMEINKLEGEGDVLHAKSIRKLYSDGSSDREAIIWTNIFEDLEKCVDATEHCSRTIESVLMKNT